MYGDRERCNVVRGGRRAHMSLDLSYFLYVGFVCSVECRGGLALGSSDRSQILTDPSDEE